MKKLFNQNRKPYDEEQIEWEEEYAEEYTEDSEVYEDEEGEEAYYEDSEYDGEDSDEYYAEESDKEYLWEAEEYYEEDSDEYYADDGEEYYADDEGGTYENDSNAPAWRRSAVRTEEHKNFFLALWEKFLHMNAMDRVVASTGILVLVLALVTGTVYVSASMINKQVASFGTVGSQLDNIAMIGESGLMAVTDAELARILAANAVEDEEEDTEYDESEYSKDVKIELNMTSIQKDLKIKFVNSKSNKLVPNVPFKVDVKTPDGSTEVWEDDDKDGIIYKKGIVSGNYSVSMQALEGEKYADFTVPTGSAKVEVKEKIAYNKVDVSDEIKKESEINASKEDTKKNGTDVESTLTDTVTWVESTKKLVDAAYTAVPRGNVANPVTASVGAKFMRLGSVTVTVGDKVQGEFDTPPADTSETTYESKNPDIASVSSTGEITGIKAGTTEVKVTYTHSVSGSDALTSTSTCSVQVVAANVPVTGITLNQTTMSVAVGGSGTLTAIVAPADATDKTVVWTSADPSIATVLDGAVKGVKAGSTTITAKSGDKQATCTVTVGTNVTAIKLNQTTATLPVNGYVDLKVTIEPSNATNQTVTWKTGNSSIATVENGRVTGKAKGSVDITAMVGSLTAVCKVTVGDRSITLDKSTLTVLTDGTGSVKATVNGATGGTVEAVSSDTGKVTASVSDKTITVKGIAAGSATITVIHKENGVETKATFTVNVKNKATKLVDASGKQLYVYTGKDSQNKEVYREATYADYASYDTFYLKTEGTYKYTGWQTLNGKLFYFDANGKYVTGEQVIQGAKYSFASDGSLVTGNGQFGIDVSKWNGTIDWNAVKNSGVNYVIIRCGYRGSSAGTLIEDPKFKANIKGATAAGIKVGVYFFTQAIDEVEAVEEASMVLGLIKNYKISYPVFLDVESSGGRADGISTQTRTAVIKAFCETIQNSGYTAGVYANKSWLTSKIDAGQLSKYKIWLAQYASAPTYAGRYDLWQYKSTGKVSGISGNVDLNLSYLGY